MRTAGISLPNGSESMGTEIAQIGLPVMGTGSKQMLFNIFFEGLKIISELKLVEELRLIITTRGMARIGMIYALIGR